MKTHIYSFFFLVLLAGCNSSVQPEDGIVEIDLSRNYPEKQIDLKDIAHISYYLPGSEDENFLFRGIPFHISDNWFIVSDARQGDFYFFDRQGLPVSHFNRKGNGPEEFNGVLGAQYDDKKNELYVATRNKVQVYDCNGVWKRTLPLPENAFPQSFHIFDDESLLFHDSQYSTKKLLREENPDADRVEFDLNFPEFMRVSRQDGAILDVIPVPQTTNGIGVQVNMDGKKYIVPGPQRRIVRNKDGFLLFSQETDTMYYYGAGKQLVPVWVQFPSATTMAKPGYLNSFVEGSNYQFFDNATLDPDRIPVYDIVALMRDKRDGSIYTQKIFFDEYKGKDIVINSRMMGQLLTPTMGCIELPVDELYEAYEENRLSGELKEIFSTMKEEDNSLYMLLDFK